MAKHRRFWHEMLRTGAQWLGVGIASIPAGIILGVLLSKGVPVRESQAIAVPIGFVVALILWSSIGRWLAFKPTVIIPGVAQTVIKFEITDGVVRTVPVLATVVLCVSVHMPVATSPMHQVTPITPVHVYAVSKS